MTERIDFIKAVLRFKRTIAGFASTQEHGTGLDEEVTADAAAFLEYLKGIENRFEAAERRVAELEEAKRWNRVTDTEPPDGVRVLMQVEAWRRGRIWQYLAAAMLVRGWKPLPPVLRSWPPPTEEGGDGS